MKKWIIILFLCSIFTDALFVHSAFAVPQFTNSSGATPGWMNNCNNFFAATNSGFVGPLVQCFAHAEDNAANDGIIPMVFTNLMINMRPYFLGIVASLFALAAVIYGVMMTQGRVRQLKGETFILIFKAAGILYFIANGPALYLDAIHIILDLGNMIAKAATSLPGSSITGCTSSMPNASDALWGQWDCIFVDLFGISAGTLAASGLMGFLLGVAVNGGLGIAVFFLGIYLVLSLLFGAVRFVQIYVMAILSLSFMFFIGYLFVPLLIFENTKSYFDKWLSICIGYILVPVLTFGYMAMLLVALNVSILTGSYSVLHQIGGTGFSLDPSAANYFPTYFTNLLYTPNTPCVPSNPLTPVTVGSSGGCYDPTKINQSSPYKYMYDGYFRFGGVQHDNNNYPNPSNPNKKFDFGFDPSTASGFGGTQGTVHNYTTGAAANNNIPSGLTVPSQVVQGTSSVSSPHPMLGGVGLRIPAVNLETFAKALTPAKSQGQYIIDIVISLASTVVLIYLLFSLLSYIPKLASDLATEGNIDSIKSAISSRVFNQGGGSSFSQQAIGESSAGGLANSIKDLASGGSKGGGGLGKDVGGGR